jgi:hypothetical protein
VTFAFLLNGPRATIRDSIRAVAAAGCLLACEPALAADAAGVLTTFAACSADFFPYLEQNAKALGPASVHESPVSDPLQAGAAMLAAPVAVHGLHITGFSQGAPPPGSRKPYYHWGFQVTETPLAAVTAITQFAPTAAFRERRGEYGWVMELEPEWKTQGDGTAIEHRSPTRMMLVRPSRDPAVPGSSIECGVLAPLMTDHEILPKVSTMFGAAH